VLACREHLLVHRASELRPGTVMELLGRCDALRKPDRFALLLNACLADARGRLGFEGKAYPSIDYLLACRDAARAVDAGAIAARLEDKSRIAEVVLQARVEAIAAVDKSRYFPQSA